MLQCIQRIGPSVHRVMMATRKCYTTLSVLNIEKEPAAWLVEDGLESFQESYNVQGIVTVHGLFRALVFALVSVGQDGVGWDSF